MTTKQRNDRIIKLRQQGRSLAAIGADVGLTRERVRVLCRDLGVIPSKAAAEELRRAGGRALVERGADFSAMGRAGGKSRAKAARKAAREARS